MKITQVTHIEITFSVEEHINTEGGMDIDTFEEGLDTLEDAVSALITARTLKPTKDWQIIGTAKEKKEVKIKKDV